VPVDDADLLILSEFSKRLASNPTPGFEIVLSIIRELIPCSSVSFNDMTLATNDFRYTIVPATTVDLAQKLKPKYDEFIHQHPLVNMSTSTPGIGALRFCDAPADPVFTETDLYQQFFQPFGIRYQLAIQLPSPPDVVVGYALNRDAEQGEFTDHDVEMLNAMTGTLAMHHRLVLQAEHSRAITEEVGHDGWTVLTVRSDGTIEASSTTPTIAGLTPGQKVPPAVVNLLPGNKNSNHGITTHDLAMGEDRWRCVVQPVPVGPTVLMMRRLGQQAGHGCHLRAAGLTPRQADVAIELASSGGTNIQLARTLGMAEGTVKKHLEAVFRVLNVDSRSAAIVVLRELEAP